MRIHALELQNIKCYEEARITLEHDFNAIIARNGSGKTTLLDAIVTGVLGRCQSTDKAGKGLADLVRYDHKQGTISLAVSANEEDPPTVITRFIEQSNNKLMIQGQSGNKTQLQSNIYNMLGDIDPDVIYAALSTNEFVHEMKPGEQKDMLFKLSGLRAERSKVVEMIAEELGDEAAEMASQALGSFTGNYEHDLGATFDSLYGHFYQQRRDVNRDLKNLGDVHETNLASADLPNTKAAAAAQLEGLRAEKADLQGKRVQAVAAVKERQRLEAQIADLAPRLKDAGNPEAAQTETDDLMRRIQILSSQSDAKRLQASTYSETADKLASAGKACPLGPEGLVQCAMTAAKREKLVGKLRTQASAATESADKLDVEVRPLQERYAELKVLRNKPSREAVQFQIDAARQELEKVPVIEDPEDLTDAQLQQLTERIGNGERLLADINREEGAAEERQRQQEKRGELSRSVEVLDALVDVLSPKGLPGRILAETIGPVEARANEMLRKLTGGRYSLRFEFDPDFAIIVDHDGVSAPLKLLCSSERMRVGIVLQDALAHLSGLRFMIIDNCDILDPENRALLMDGLLELRGDYDQIIILSTVGPAGVTNPHIDGLGMYMLEDGQLMEVE